MASAHVILWDFDGTLAYREGMWSGTLHEVAQRECPFLRVEREHFRPFMKQGFPWHEPDKPHPDITDAETWWNRMHPIFEGAFTANGVEPAQARSMAPMVREAYLAPDKWHLFEDTVPALMQLSEAGWRHRILSNHVPELPALAGALGLSRFFDDVCTSALCGFEKPHPEAFAAASRGLPRDAAVVMVGDNPIADIHGARAAGLSAVLVRHRAAPDTGLCPGLTELPSLLAGLLSTTSSP